MITEIEQMRKDQEDCDSLLRVIRARAENDYHETALNDIRDLLDRIESLNQVIALAYGILWHVDLWKTGQHARHVLRDVLTPLRRELGINDAKSFLATKFSPNQNPKDAP